MLEKVIKKQSLLFSLLIAFLCYYSMLYGLRLNDKSVLTNSIFSIILIGLFSIIIKRTIKIFNKRLFYCSVPIGAFFSFSMIIGAQFSIYRTVALINKKALISMIFLTILFTAIVMLLIGNKEVIEKKIIEISNNDIVNKIFKPTKKCYFGMFMLMVIIWLPTYLAAYPGIFSYDALHEALEVFQYKEVTTFQPPIHTYYLDGLLYLGKKLFDSYNIGLAVHCISQGLIMIAIFSYACLFLIKHNVPKILVLFAYVFFAIFPLNMLMAFIVTKDVIFSGIMLLLFLFTIDIYVDSEKFFSSKLLIARYIITIVMMCLFRNQGVYVVVFSIPFFVLLLKKYWKKFLCVLVFSVILLKIITGPIYNLCNIGKGDAREALSVPIQQIARVMNRHLSEISEEDRESVYNIIPEENLPGYIEVIADPVKSYFNTANLLENPVKYAKLWARFGLRYPIDYIDSFLFGSFAYIYPDTQYPIWDGFLLYDDDYRAEAILGIKRESLLPGYAEKLRKISYEGSYQKIPVVSTLLNPAFAFWCMVIAVGTFIYNKKYKFIAPIIMLVGLWGTLLLGPVILIRYGYPLIVCVPILIPMIFTESLYEAR